MKRKIQGTSRRVNMISTNSKSDTQSFYIAKNHSQSEKQNGGKHLHPEARHHFKSYLHHFESKLSNPTSEGRNF